MLLTCWLCFGFAAVAILNYVDTRLAISVGMVAMIFLAVGCALSRLDGHLIVLLLISSAIQRPLSAWSGDSLALLLDDAVLVVMVASVILRAPVLFKRNPFVAFSAAALIIYTLAEVQLSPDIATAFSQWRQVTVPIVLLLFGYLVRPGQLRVVKPIVLCLGVVASIYAIVEFYGVYPIDPNGYSSLQAGRDRIVVRDLPGFYYYFYGPESYLMRSGTFLLNPPSAGIYLGATAVWVWLGRTRFPTGRVLITLLLATAAALTLSRAALIIFVLLALQPVITRRLGARAFPIFAAVPAGLALNELLSHGGTIRHLDGAMAGISVALTHPVGGGFGVLGNVTKDWSGDGVGESLGAIFLVATGWFGILVIVAVLWRGISVGHSIPGVALTSAILVSLFSETAGGLDAAGALWLLAGAALPGSASAHLVAPIPKIDSAGHPVRSANE